MNKIFRGVLYVSSILLVGLVFFAAYQNVKENKSYAVSDETVKVSAENEEETVPEKKEVSDETQQAKSTETTDTLVKEKESTESPVKSETTLVFTGDILIGNAVSANYDAGGTDGVLSKDMQDILKNADIVMVNEEFPFSERGVQMEDKQFTFRMNPRYVSLFKDMGVDIVSLANNHVLDYGAEALSDTFMTLDEAGILYAGAGESEERAKEPQIIEVNGKKYGFLAASRVLPVASWNVENTAPGVFSTYDATALVEEIKKVRAECDYLTVFVHWGLERKEYPESYQKTLAMQYIDAGADAVIGSHSHCLQGVEYINGKPVFYSLGNFLFGQDGNTVALKAVIGEDGSVTYAFVAAKEQGARTISCEETEAKSLYDYLTSISVNAVVRDDGVIESRE
ncbi:MAG: CapA family protein [Lachnospiraceae bacterium]|nr:CapA family protein [Lachnospiraceae bacterium]